MSRLSDSAYSDHRRSFPLWFPCYVAIRSLFCCTIRKLPIVHITETTHVPFMLLCTITDCTSRHGNYFQARHWYRPWSRHGQYRGYLCTISPRGAVDHIMETVRDQMCTVSGSISCTISPRGAVDHITETVRDQMCTISGSISSGRFLLNPEFSG